MGGSQALRRETVRELDIVNAVTSERRNAPTDNHNEISLDPERRRVDVFLAGMKKPKARRTNAAPYVF